MIAQNPSRAYRLSQHAKLVVGSMNEITTIFRCNEEELESVAKEEIKNYDGKIIVITKGERGATLISADEVLEFPAYNVPVIDTTGAGDAFTAGILYGLIKGRPLKEIIKIASACSAICIQEIGARSGPKNRKELLKFLRKN